MRIGRGIVALGLVVSSACGAGTTSVRGEPSAPPPALPAPLVRAPRPVPATWHHWEPVEPIIPDGPSRGPALPLAQEQVDPLRAELGEIAREKLRVDGVVTLDGSPTSEVASDAIAGVTGQNAWMLTLDALAPVVRGALDASLAELEDVVVKPALATLLARLGARLSEMARTATAELAEPLAIARGLVAVARELAGEGAPATKDLPKALAARVAAERALVEAHAGVAPSPLLGVPLDYSAIGLDRAPIERRGPARALSWLGGAPLMLASIAEVAAAPADVALARAHTRAAMILTALLDEKDGDRAAADAHARVARALAFVYGAPDDVSPDALRRTADALRVRVDALDDIADVTKVDRVRRACLTAHAPRVYDGAGDVEVPLGAPASPTGAPRAALAFRVFPPHGAPDAAALQAMVFPSVGRATGTSATPTAREGVRTLPSVLDVAAWLGAREAEVALREAGDDAFVGLLDVRARLAAARPPDQAPQRHASLTASAIDLLFAYVGPSRSRVRLAEGPSARRMRAESALAAWLMLARVAPPFMREPALAKEPAPAPAPAEGVPGVEPHPEAFGRLLALVRQASRGLLALGLDPRSPGLRSLAAAERIADAAFLASARLARDEAWTQEERAALAFAAAELRGLEAHLGPRARAARATDVHGDAGGTRALVAGTGAVERAYVVVPVAGGGPPRIAIAAHLPVYEKVVGLADRAQIAWREEVRRAPPRRVGLASAFHAP